MIEESNHPTTRKSKRPCKVRKRDLHISTMPLNSTVNSTLVPNTFSPGFRLSAAMFSIIMILVTIFGNTLVIAAFSLQRRMRTVTNSFLVSLACTDLCVAAFSMPVWLAYLLTGPEWTLGEILKYTWTMVDILVGTASIMNLMAISFTRFLSLRNPLRFSEWITSRTVAAIIICVWIYSIGIAVTSHFLYSKRIFNLVVTITCFYAPLLFILGAHFMTFKVALTQVRQIRATVPAQYLGNQNNVLKEYKAAKTISVIVGAFLMCWLPFVTLNVIYSLCDTSHDCPIIAPELIMASKCLHYGNSLLNPIIYSIMNRDFKKAFLAILCSRS